MMGKMVLFVQNDFNLGGCKIWCEIQAGDYVWQTYEQVYQKVIQIGAAIRGFGVKPVSQECCSVF
jgi:hypothetical protein